MEDNRPIEANIFQYNTCFYLSWIKRKELQKVRNFNTTLVFIYRSNFVSISSISLHFNTTLVFIYQTWETGLTKDGNYFNTTLVFIYLIRSYCVCSALKFQYNTCFYLSGITILRFREEKISIQHLFLFICSAPSTYQGSSHFNTTLVFIYPTYFRHSLFPL